MKKLIIFVVGLYLGSFAGVANASLSDGLYAHFEFENDIQDSSPRNISGDIHGSPSFVPGVVGQSAIKFDGTTAITFQDQYLFPLCEGTISVFVKVDPSLDYIVDLMDSKTNYRTPPTYSHAEQTFGYSSTIPITPGEWTMYTYVYTNGCSSNGVRKGYRNGELYSETSGYSNNAYIGTWYMPQVPFYSVIGADLSNWIWPEFTEGFKGEVDDIRIYSRALSEAEIQEIYGTANNPL